MVEDSATLVRAQCRIDWRRHPPLFEVDTHPWGIAHPGRPWSYEVGDEHVFIKFGNDFRRFVIEKRDFPVEKLEALLFQFLFIDVSDGQDSGGLSLLQEGSVRSFTALREDSLDETEPVVRAYIVIAEKAGAIVMGAVNEVTFVGAEFDGQRWNVAVATDRG